MLNELMVIGGNWFGTIMYWASYVIVLLFFVGGLLAITYITGFKYKIHYWEVIGEANEDGLTIDKLRKNRAKWNKDRTAWILLYPLFKGKTINPFDAKNIYAGKACYAFKFHDDYLPAKILLNDKVGSINPIPFYIRNWQKLELKENELDFAKSGFWEQNKMFIQTVITAALCLGLVGITVYYVLEFATGGRDQMSNLADAIRGLSVVGGKPPA